MDRLKTYFNKQLNQTMMDDVAPVLENVHVHLCTLPCLLLWPLNSHMVAYSQETIYIAGDINFDCVSHTIAFFTYLPALTARHKVGVTLSKIWRYLRRG